MAIARTPEEEQAVRDNLIAVCASVFLRDGYSKSTMKSLSDEAGCTTGKFYSNFSGKPEILSVLMEKFERTNYREAVRLLGAENDSEINKIVLFFVMQYEICHVNDKIRELFYYTYEDTETIISISKNFVPLLDKALSEEYGRKESEQMLMIRSVMAFGIIRSILIGEHRGFGYAEQGQMDAMLQMICHAFDINDKDAKKLFDRVEAAKPAIREATYNMIIYMLQTKLN